MTKRRVLGYFGCFYIILVFLCQLEGILGTKKNQITHEEFFLFIF